MSIQTQVTGFARHQIGEFTRIYGVDARSSWMGREINDKLLVSLRENAEKLAKVSFVGARACFVVIDASKLFVWEAKLAKDGQTYERVSALKETTRGTLDGLRAAYGKANVYVVDEAGAKKLCASKKADRGTLAFYSLERLAKTEKAEKTDVKASGKGANKAKDSKTVAVNAKTAKAVVAAAAKGQKLVIAKAK